MSRLGGRVIRSKNRTDRRASIELKADGLILSALQSLNSCPVDELRYKAELAELLVLINQMFPQMAHRTVAKNRLIRHVEIGNREGRWSLPLPNPTIKLRRHSQYRTLERHGYSAEAARIASALLEAMRYPDLFRHLGDEDYMHMVLLSAILFGGLNNLNSVHGFCRFLMSGGRPERVQIAGQVLYCVYFQVQEEEIANVYSEGRTELWRRWYCDPISLGMISQFDKNRKLEVADYKVGNILKNINTLLEKIGITRWQTSSTGEMVMSGAAVSEQLDNVDISAALVGVACGKILTTSIPVDAWRAVMQAQYVIRDRYNLAPVYQKYGRPSKRGPFVNQKMISFEFQRLATIVKLTGDGLRKRTAEQAVKELLAIDVSEWSIAGEALRDWYVCHLQDRSNSLSTINRYHFEVAKYWFDGSISNDYKELDSNDWEEYYESVLGNHTKPSNRVYRAGRFQDLHDFCVGRFKFTPAIVDGNGVADKSAKYVHASYIGYGLYVSVKEAVLRSDNLTDNEKLDIELMTVMAYRLGLRVSEICKLRLCDIDCSAEGWVFVRENIYGNNKSSSSLRKIPAMVLMSNSEWDRFRRYVTNRRLYSESSKELLFHQSFDKYTPWDKRYISAFVGALLRDISGLTDLVFHSFRHTALSNLQLVIEQEWEAASKFMSIDVDQLKAIYRAIVGSDEEKLRRYWALACFAGHNDPSVSFHSYLHFSDLLIGLKLSRAKYEFTRDQLVSMTGLSASNVTRRMRKFGGDVRKIASSITMPSIEVNFESVDNSCECDTGISVDYPDQFTSMDSHDQAYMILEEYQAGAPESVLSHKYGISEERLSCWIQNGRSLLGIETREGNSRLITKDRSSKGKFNIVLLPPRLNSVAEKKDAKLIIKLLNKQFVSEGKDRQAMLNLINFYLRHVTTSNSGIRVTDPKTLVRFINRLESAGIVPVSRWAIRIICPKNTEPSEEWHDVEKLPVKKIEIDRSSKITTSSYLRLTHPEEEKIIAGANNFRKCSARTLRYVFHMIAIMQFDESFFIVNNPA